MLRRLCDLFALWAAEKQLATLFEGGYFTSRTQSLALKRAVIELCAAVKARRRPLWLAQSRCAAAAPLMRRSHMHACAATWPSCVHQDDAVALVDVIAPPDHILFSPIGRSNGEAYKNLFGAIVATPGGTRTGAATGAVNVCAGPPDYDAALAAGGIWAAALQRASWWPEFLDKPVPGSKRVPPPTAD